MRSKNLLCFVLIAATCLFSRHVLSTEITDLDKNESQIESPPLLLPNEPKIPEQADNANDAITQNFKAFEQLEDDVEIKVDELKEDSNNSESFMIPVFSEWKQEAEKKLELTNSTEPNKEVKNETLAKHQIVKMRQKNYASPDCGAKILASNPEAQSTSSVLTDKDEYLLSPCTDRIWFVVELCDSIQSQRVELANFELFSSPLKSVSISVSNRFPTRDWTLAGQFDAKTERGIQEFDLNASLFGKFVRVDLTYTNTEHYCPLSFFRIYGTSEIEAFEVDNDAANNLNAIDDDDDDEFEHQAKEEPNKDNLLNRAGAAVMSIVQKAAEVLAKTNGNGTKSNETAANFLRSDCTSFSHILMCHGCSNEERVAINDLISCKNLALSSLLESNIEIRRHLENSVICHKVLGFDLRTDAHESRKSFFTSILPHQYIAAMCNLLASDQNSLPLRIEDASGEHTNLVSKKDEISLKNVSKKAEPVDDTLCQQDFYSTTTENPNLIVEPVEVNSIAEIAAEIATDVQDQKNETVTGDELNIFNVVEQQTENSSSTESSEAVVVEPPEKPAEAPKEEPTLQELQKAEEVPVDSFTEPTTVQSDSSETFETKNVPVEVKAQNEVKNDQADSRNNGDVRYSNPPESVFLRLSNRIKTLEKNMTLSTQYLEELSRRYKKQIEELQQSFLKLHTAIEDQAAKKREKDKEEIDDKNRLREVVLVINQKAEYMEVILIVVCVFLAFQTIFIFALFKRISILRKSFANVQLQLQLKDVAKPPTPIQLNGSSRSGRKRSKQRTRKISAPNILTQRSPVKSDFSPPAPVLNRTVSAPNKFNASMSLTDNKENYEDMQAMLEENDDILIPGFEELKINDDTSVNSHNLDTVSTVSAVSSNGKLEKSSSNRSFKFKRRLSSPFQKSSLKQSSSDQTNQTWSKKAMSESPPRLNNESFNGISKSKSFHEDDDGSGKFKKSNSFKKLFKKLF